MEYGHFTFNSSSTGLIGSIGPIRLSYWGQLTIGLSKLPSASWLVEADKDGLRRERNAEIVRHSLLNLLHQADHFTRGRAAAIDDRQRMPRRDSHPPAVVAFMKSRAFDQPGGRDFKLAI